MEGASLAPSMLEAWYTKFEPTKKPASKSAGKAADGIDDDWDFINVNNFDDPLAVGIHVSDLSSENRSQLRYTHPSRA